MTKPDGGKQAEAAARPTALYRHYDAEGVLLYVGISLNALSRLADHKHVSSWFQQITRVDIQWLPSRTDALEAERRAIIDEKPRHNLQHNTKPVYEVAPPDDDDSVHDDARAEITRKVIEFAPLYSLGRAASLLGLAESRMRAFMDQGLLGYVVINESEFVDRNGDNRRRETRGVTGWQLIDFLEAMETSDGG